MWEKWEHNYILLASTYMWLNYNKSIHQIISASKNKAKPYQIISNDKAKIITFFIWRRGASENMFEMKHLVHLKVGGLCRCGYRNLENWGRYMSAIVVSWQKNWFPDGLKLPKITLETTCFWRNISISIFKFSPFLYTMKSSRWNLVNFSKFTNAKENWEKMNFVFLTSSLMKPFKIMIICFFYFARSIAIFAFCYQ